MAGPKPTDGYTPYATVSPETSAGNDYLRVEATPANMGALVGQGLQKAGQDVEQTGDIFQKYVQQSTEAKVNDDYANKYAPAAADLRSKYDQLRGQDKVAGYDGYVKGLKDLNQQFVSSQPNLIGQRLMGGLVDRHISGEIDGAQRELGQSLKQFNDQATFDAIKADAGYAASNYNNPSIAGPDGQVAKTNDARLTLQFMDSGHDPDSPALAEAQKTVKGDQAYGMITRAVAGGDVSTANDIRGQFSDFMPGYKKLQIDNFLHAANMQQTSAQGKQAVVTGAAIPEPIGAPAAQVQSLVANTAQKSGVDTNAALAVVRIESSNGQNLGTRGTLGQDKESAGKSQEEQAQALCNNLKQANTTAQTALGRAPEGWESYAVYQQGVGGGAALLKADQSQKAIDVLTPLYPDQKTALQAITNNGGNATMSVGDFLGHIKDTYNQNFDRSKCEFAGDASHGDQIAAPHQQTGTAVQPAPTPRQALLNFDSKAPDMISRIQAIPNLDVRKGVMEAYVHERSMYQAASTAYTTKLISDAAELANKPDFTDMKQVPAEMYSALAQDSPTTIHMLMERAEYNMNHGGVAASKDMVTYGKNWSGIQNQIWNGQIKDVSQLHDAYNRGDITQSGLEKATEALTKPKDPEGEANSKLEEQTFKAVKGLFLGKAEMYGIPDPQGEQTYGHAMTLVYKAIEDAHQKGISPREMFDPSSKDWVGNAAKPLVKSMEQRAAEIGRPAISTPEGLRYAILNGEMTKEAGQAEAIKRGYIPAKSLPSVPLAGSE